MKTSRERRTLLVTLDPDPKSWNLESSLIDQAAHLARRLDVDLTLLHVGFDPALGSAGRRPREKSGEEMDGHRLRYLARQRVRQQSLARQIFDRFGLRARVSTRWDDDRSQAILRTAKRWPTLLILKEPEPTVAGERLSRQDARLLRTTCAPVWLVAGSHRRQPLSSDSHRGDINARTDFHNAADPAGAARTGGLASR
jgi:hypothetical protein